MRSRLFCTSLGWPMSTSMPCFTLSSTHASAVVGGHGVGLDHPSPGTVPGEGVVHPPGDVLGVRVRAYTSTRRPSISSAANQVDERALLRVELLLRRPKSSLTIAATNVGDGTKALNPFNVRLNNRLIQFPCPAMEAANPGSRSHSTDVFCGWFKAGAHRPARQPVGSAVSPASAFHGRSTH